MTDEQRPPPDDGDHVTQEQLNTILRELVLGVEPTLRTPAADLARDRLRQQVADIKAKGGTVEIPFD